MPPRPAASCPAGIYVAPRRLVVVEHGDGETLTRFSYEETITERYGAGHERPRGGGARRDGVVTGTPTGAAHRRRTPRVGADEMPQEAETIKYGMTVMVLRLMVVDKTARITVNWPARCDLVSH